MVFPVFYNDPFLKYRPFPAEETGNNFIDHWHEIAATFLFYTAIQYGSQPFSRYYFGDTYKSLKPKTKINFDIHVVSMVQCFISILLLLPMWNSSLWSESASSSVHGLSPYGSLVAAVTCGYFAWDVYVCLRYYSLFGFGFLFHGVAALYVFCLCLIPFCQPWIPAFLLFELSTPFVNINWFSTRLPAGTFSDRTILINGVLLLITFFSVRLVWGIYAVIQVALDFYRIWGHVSPFLVISILSINVSLDILNVFWFYKMLMIAKKKITGKSKKL
ncbi:DUF887-domain-containing protein [Suhomyces tanzawaensis NRRL Y-17324]|uniref:DUF887-domain-containing protein n=1 Tax=Suhomyces tanzawaensis NRRL Y-17324 TaxID=984487 RepID=A0A1E4SD13_9ASCO|nr:DUF887-domain-containing protein [Suhomyces tanzawaensis NRRL Y-17324]ODV77358.1 DUF887-domain-containing protein [Suhomyces tanzawaensis NRRL Y-17324]